jgi:hypothetical protein
MIDFPELDTAYISTGTFRGKTSLPSPVPTSTREATPGKKIPPISRVRGGGRKKEGC